MLGGSARVPQLRHAPASDRYVEWLTTCFVRVAERIRERLADRASGTHASERRSASDMPAMKASRCCSTADSRRAPQVAMQLVTQLGEAAPALSTQPRDAPRRTQRPAMCSARAATDEQLLATTRCSCSSDGARRGIADTCTSRAPVRDQLSHASSSSAHLPPGPPNTGDKLRASNTLNARQLHPLVRRPRRPRGASALPLATSIRRSARAELVRRCPAGIVRAVRTSTGPIAASSRDAQRSGARCDSATSRHHDARLRLTTAPLRSRRSRPLEPLTQTSSDASPSATRDRSADARRTAAQ